jgi:hypothetical protein
VSDQQHIIKRLIFEITITTEEEGFQTQQAISGIWQQSLYSELEKLLNGLSTGKEMISIDKLEVDLGDIENEVLHEQLTEKTREVIGEKLLQVISAARISSSAEAYTAEEKTMVTFRSTATSKLELLTHFLQTGTLPWWTRKEETHVSSLFDHLVSEEPAQLRIELSRILKNKNYRKRFIYQFSDKAIINSLKLFDRSFAEFAETVAEDMMSLERISMPGISQAALRTHVWNYFTESVTVNNTGTSGEEKKHHISSIITTGTHAVEILKTVISEISIVEEKRSTFKTPGLINLVKKIIATEKSNTSLISSTTGNTDKNERSSGTSGEEKELKKLRLKKALSKKRKKKNFAKDKASEINNEDSEIFIHQEIAGDENKFTNDDDNVNEYVNAVEIENAGPDDLLSEKIIDLDAAGTTGSIASSKQEDNTSSHSITGSEESTNPGKAGNLTTTETGKEAFITRGGSEKQRTNTTESKKESRGTDDLQEKKKSVAAPGDQLRKAFDIDDNDELTAVLSEGIYINNAGLVILWPYLSAFFHKLQLMNVNTFISEEVACHAVHLLQYLATGSDVAAQEHELILNKVLCGIDPDEPLSMDLVITEEERAECAQLLQAIANNWTALKSTSPEGIRDTFLVKEGLLNKGNGWTLKIERTTVDMLIDKLPWGISIIKLPWCNDMLYVEW